MNSLQHRLAAAAALTAALLLAGTGAVFAQGAPASGAHVVKLTNTDKQAITAIYASAPGKNDWGDDLLGKQTAAAGRTVSLSFKAPTPESCVQDLQMLMNDGKVVEKAGVNVCETAAYQFAP
jgi:hypothetical protein